MPQNNNDGNIIAKRIASIVSLDKANEYRESAAAETDANQDSILCFYRAQLGYVGDL